MQLLKQPLRLTNIVINHLNGKVMVKHIVLFKLKDEAPADEKSVSYTHLTLPTN